MGAQNRIMIMQKLASSANIDIPVTKMPVVNINYQKLSNINNQSGLLGPPSPFPTNCLLPKNMFDPNIIYSDQEWELEIYEDVKSEASKNGLVSHIFVDKNSQGYVYIKMLKTDSAVQTYNMLNGRVYGNRQITVEYQFLKNYEEKFMK